MEEGEDARNGSPKTTARLRSACDSCHKSKIRCSGGNPCVTCQLSNNRCTYSPLNRLGRPKGSKNRRTLSLQQNNSKREGMQQRASHGERRTKHDGNDRTSEDAEVRHYLDYGSTDSNIDFNFDATLLEESVAPEAIHDHSKLPFSPTLSSIIDSLNETHMQGNSGGGGESSDVNGNFNLVCTRVPSQNPALWLHHRPTHARNSLI